MNLEKDKKELQADREALQEKISTVEARIETIPDEISQLKITLIEQVINDKPDYPAKALVLSGLKLEQETLNVALANLKKMLTSIQSRLESIVWAISDKQAEENRKELLNKIVEMKNKGDSPKTIREELGLSQREYDRLAAKL